MDFNQLLILMAQKKGSDMFITAGRPPGIKIDGVIRNVGNEVLTPRHAHDLVYSVMNQKQQKEFEETKECQFAIDAKGVRCV